MMHDFSPIPSDGVETDEDDAMNTASTDAAAVHTNAINAVPDPNSYIDEDAVYPRYRGKWLCLP